MDAIEARGGEAVVPAQSNRAVPRAIDADRYGELNFLAFVPVVSMMVLLQ